MVNHNYFLEEHTLKHYVLGLCHSSLIKNRISKSGMYFRSKNREIMELIKSELETDNKIVSIEKRGCFQLYIKSGQIYSSLCKHGARQNRNYRTFPDSLSLEERTGFISGLIDSKGEIESENCKIMLHIKGVESYLEEVSEIISTDIKINNGRIKRCWLSYSNEEVIAIYNSYVLGRRFTKAQEKAFKNAVESFNSILPLSYSLSLNST